MKLTADGAAFIRAHEGFVPKLYLCPAGVPTIGIGFTMRSKAFREWWIKHKPGMPFARGVTITRIEADHALMYLVEHEFGEAVDAIAPANAPQHAKESACSMAYNCGAGSLEWKWGKAFSAGNYALAAELMRSTAVTAKRKGGRIKLPGLVRRRKEEALLMEHGKYTGLHGAAQAVVDCAADGILERGEHGKPVKDLQKLLTLAGFYEGQPDGIFGRGTEAAVMAVQDASDIAVDGLAGKITLDAITSILDKRKANAAQIEAAKKAAALVEDVAATDRVSTSQIAIGVASLSGLVSTGTQVADTASQAKDAVDQVIDLGPWVLLAIFIIGAWWWVHRERSRKSKTARLIGKLIQ